MLEVTSIIVMSIVLLCLTILMVTLFIKHLNVMYVFIEEMLKAQNLLYKELQAIRLNLARYKNNEGIDLRDVIENDSTYRGRQAKNQNNEIQEDYKSGTKDLESTEVSEEELAELIKGKELLFSSNLTVSANDEFINRDITL